MEELEKPGSEPTTPSLEQEDLGSKPTTPSPEQGAGAAQRLCIAAVQLKIVGESLGILQDFGKQLELVSFVQQQTCRVTFKDGTSLAHAHHPVKEKLPFMVKMHSRIVSTVLGRGAATSNCFTQHGSSIDNIAILSMVPAAAVVSTSLQRNFNGFHKYQALEIISHCGFLNH